MKTLTGSKVVIVGGVAGGASAAARARRLSENSEIILLEKGAYISFANCGLPYYISGVIKNREQLLLQTPESFKKRFNIDVRVFNEVISINRDEKNVHILNHQSGESYVESYDKLVISTGAYPIRPNISNINHPRVATLRTLDDLDQIMSLIQNKRMEHVTVVGGGFIGLEVVESLRYKNIKTTFLEFAPQVMTTIDLEMANFIHQELIAHGVDLRLNTALEAIDLNSDDTLNLILSDHNKFKTDLVILAIGVRPNIELAQKSGLDIGMRGGIKISSDLKTSDPNIYAVGDVIETEDFLTHQPMLVPLAGPANRQGRIVADQIFGKNHAYQRTQGTAICKIFDLSVASLGVSEKRLKAEGVAYEKVYTHGLHHAGYYPDAQMLSIKLLFTKEDGKILGACIIGKDGVDKRIDVLSVAQRAGMTVYDLEHLELSYAPPYGSAKDPINIAGFVACNWLRGDMEGIHYDALSALSANTVILDVRTYGEVTTLGMIPLSIHIPVDELRERMDELPKDQLIVITCQIGLRGNVAYHLLIQNGFKVKNLIGGYRTWKMAHYLMS